jgi:hypothetical protein
MAQGAIFQYASPVHICAKIWRQIHTGAHFGPLRAIEAGRLLSVLHTQPIRLSFNRDGDAARDSILKIVRQ